MNGRTCYLENEVSLVRQELRNIATSVRHLEQSRSEVKGVTYIRWGRTVCPERNGTELVYAGRIGGSLFSLKGGGANILCLPDDPVYGNYQPGVQNYSPMYGGVYYTDGATLPSSNNYKHASCAVCFVSNRNVKIMVPARNRCPDGQNWSLEYSGYLMVSPTKFTGDHRGTFNCIDGTPDIVPGFNTLILGHSFFHSEARCDSFKCPPYDPQKELTCAVCTK